MKWLAAVGGILLVGATILYLLRRPTQPAEPDRTKEVQQQNDALRDTLASVKGQLATLDTAKAIADSFAEEALDSVDALEGKITNLLRQGTQVDTVWQRGVPIQIDSMADSVALASTCEERYDLRTLQATYFRRAVSSCQQGRAIAETKIGTLQRTLGSTVRQLERTEAAVQWERDRERPCRRDWKVVQMPCLVVDLLLVGGTFAATR